MYSNGLDGPQNNKFNRNHLAEVHAGKQNRSIGFLWKDISNCQLDMQVILSVTYK